MGIYILNFLLNFYCVIIHWNIDIGIWCFLGKVLNFDIFCRDKSWIPFECNRGTIDNFRMKIMEYAVKKLYLDLSLYPCSSQVALLNNLGDLLSWC